MGVLVERFPHRRFYKPLPSWSQPFLSVCAYTYTYQKTIIVHTRAAPRLWLLIHSLTLLSGSKHPLPLYTPSSQFITETGFVSDSGTSCLPFKQQSSRVSYHKSRQSKMQRARSNEPMSEVTKLARHTHQSGHTECGISESAIGAHITIKQVHEAPGQCTSRKMQRVDIPDIEKVYHRNTGSGNSRPSKRDR